MYTITINGKSVLKTDLTTSGNSFEGTLNDKLVNGNLIKINNHQYHLIYNNVSYNLDVIKMNAEDKTMIIKINSFVDDNFVI